MNFLKTLFWVVATAVAVIFSFENWNPVTVQLWGGFAADTRLPMLMIGSFLLGLLPMLLIHRARLWSLRRRLATLEGTAAAASSPTIAEPPDEPVVLRR